jgi:sugar/nucleoside kinase (ribokinase family)
VTGDRPQVVVAGNLSLDDTVTPEASLPEAPGGDALYASLGVLDWGGIPVLLTLVGSDYPPAHLSRMRAAGIDITHVRETEGPTVHYRVTYAPDGSRTFEWVGPEERLFLTSPQSEDFDGVRSADWLHVAAMPIDAQEVAVAAGRAAGTPISLDPHEEFVVGFEDRLRALVEDVVFMPSELEARLLFPDLLTTDPIDFGLDAAERLDEWGPRMTAVKLGPLGSVVRADGRSVHIPALSVPVVDPTGAGDSYCGGFVAGWLVTGSSVIAAACGTISAAGMIGRFGAFTDAPPATSDRRLRLVRELSSDVDDRHLDPSGDGVASLARHLTGASVGGDR